MLLNRYGGERTNASIVATMPIGQQQLTIIAIPTSRTEGVKVSLMIVVAEARRASNLGRFVFPVPKKDLKRFRGSL